MQLGYWERLAAISALNLIVVSPLATFLGFLSVPSSLPNEDFSLLFHTAGLLAALVAGLLLGFASWFLVKSHISSLIYSSKAIFVSSITLQSILAAAAWNFLSVGLFLFHLPIMCGALVLFAASGSLPFILNLVFRRTSSEGSADAG